MISNELLRQVQLKELEILLEVQRICDKHSIRYFLVGGTLLGAVRHKGFIPWDDDIDISMRRADYDRFLEVAPQEISSKYYVESERSNPDYVYSFCKVKAHGTVYMEECTSKLDIHQGIWIDIFPMEDLAELDFDKISKHAKKIAHWQTAIDYQAGIIQLTKPWSKAYFTLLGKVYHHRLLHKKIEAMKWSSYAPAKFCIDYNCPYGYKKTIFPVEMYEKTAEYQFEGHVFTGPADYDAWLTQLYGNYMQLPPVEKRVSEHGIIQVKV